MSKALVAYFSASGVTAKLAKTLAQATGGDLFEIEPAQRYAAADLDWMDKHSRSTVEMKDKNARPAIASTVENMAQYDTVYVGFPIWWYEAPRIVQTFLESYDLSGKTIVPFCTSGSSGIDGSLSGLQSLAPDADWLAGQRFSASAGAADVQSWVDNLGL